MRGDSFISCCILGIVLCLWTPEAGVCQPAAPSEEDAAVALVENTSGLGQIQIELTVPLFSPVSARFPLAEVNGEPITIGDLNSALASSHQDKKESGAGAKADYSKILERLVNVKLVLQEAENMGIGELPEIRKNTDAYSRMASRQILLTRHLANIKVEADAAEIDRIYKENVREYKIRSLLFKKEDGARKVEAELKAGGDFNEVADRAIADGTAQGSKDSGYVRLADAQPAAAAAVSQMTVGSVSPVVKVFGGFVIIRLEEVRYPERAEQRELARETAQTAARMKSLEEYKKDLIRKYAKADQKLVASVDFESKKPGFEKLLKDQRVVVRIKGEKPVTVGDWANSIRDIYYHGVQVAGENKRINKKKVEVLDDLVIKRILVLEARKKKIHETEEYRTMMDQYRDSLVFGAFLSKVVYPDVKIRQEEIDAYYKEHSDEFTNPEMARIQGLAYAKMGDAESALGKLRQGTDYKWLKDNGEGQLPPGTAGLQEWNGALVVTGSLPEGVRTAISGAREGDYRLYESPEGHAYVLYLQGLVPATMRPMEEVREAIATKVYNENLQKAMNGWFEKLRKASDVRIYLSEPCGK